MICEFEKKIINTKNFRNKIKRKWLIHPIFPYCVFFNISYDASSSQLTRSRRKCASWIFTCNCNSTLQNSKCYCFYLVTTPLCIEHFHLAFTRKVRWKAVPLLHFIFPVPFSSPLFNRGLFLLLLMLRYGSGASAFGSLGFPYFWHDVLMTWMKAMLQLEDNEDCSILMYSLSLETALAIIYIKPQLCSSNDF